MLTGLERVALSPNLAKAWGRCALVANQASVCKDYTPAWRIFHSILGTKLTTLFGPQHGFESVVQENMIETGHAVHGPTGAPVYSLYSETREPSQKMLQNVDTIIFDLPLTGCRIYTYKYTLSACLRAAKKHGKKVVVLDRPNPLGGEILEGNVLEDTAHSFVGEFPIPMRHGLTMAEAANFFNEEIKADMEIVELEGWNPKHLWDDLKREWVLTSPNMPNISACYVFPGMVLFEGTNVSEGRGTCLPFQFIGAPYLKDSNAFIETVSKYASLEGVFLRPASFQPTSAKWANEECRGVQIHVTNPRALRSFQLGLGFLRAFIDLNPVEFKWRDPPYEYNYDLLPIAVLIGKPNAADFFSEANFNVKDRLWRDGQKAYIERACRHLLYDRKMISES